MKETKVPLRPCKKKKAQHKFFAKEAQHPQKKKKFRESQMSARINLPFYHCHPEHQCKVREILVWRPRFPSKEIAPKN